MFLLKYWKFNNVLYCKDDDSIYQQYLLLPWKYDFFKIIIHFLVGTMTKIISTNMPGIAWKVNETRFFFVSGWGWGRGWVEGGNEVLGLLRKRLSRIGQSRLLH